ncbi:MAG: MerC family mercury resistance protein [Alteromonadaceae bacterium]|nr:MerC family mercury resistance protein [Alteromonadaceae bacterium]
MTNIIDRLGIWTSSLCAVHCLLFPILLPAIPLLGATIFAEHWFERTILVLSLIIGFTALLAGFFRYHRQIYPLYSLMMGGLLYWNKDLFGENLEPFAVTLGALLIVIAHVINIRLCKSCQSCEVS